MKILKDIEGCLRGRIILRKKQLSTFSTKEWWSTIRTEKCTLYFSVWRLLFWTEQLTGNVLFRNHNLCYRQIRQLFTSVQFSSVAQSCLTLCRPMNHHTPDLPVHHQLLESTQTHVHQVSDAIQPSHPLSSPSPPAPSPSQHQGLFQWVNS